MKSRKKIGKNNTAIINIKEAMITVKCIKCKRIIFKYQKIGRGNLWHCWKDRIKRDNSIREEDKVYCICGNLIGIEEEKWIKMKQHSFETSGTITRK